MRKQKALDSSHTRVGDEDIPRFRMNFHFNIELLLGTSDLLERIKTHLTFQATPLPLRLPCVPSNILILSEKSHAVTVWDVREDIRPDPVTPDSIRWRIQIFQRWDHCKDLRKDFISVSKPGRKFRCAEMLDGANHRESGADFGLQTSCTISMAIRLYDEEHSFHCALGPRADTITGYLRKLLITDHGY